MIQKIEKTTFTLHQLSSPIMSTLTLTIPNNEFIKTVHSNINRFTNTLLNVPPELINTINYYIPTHPKITSYINFCYGSHHDHGLNIFNMCHVCK